MAGFFTKEPQLPQPQERSRYGGFRPLQIDPSSIEPRSNTMFGNPPGVSSRYSGFGANSSFAPNPEVPVPMSMAMEELMAPSPVPTPYSGINMNDPMVDDDYFMDKPHNFGRVSMPRSGEFDVTRFKTNLYDIETRGGTIPDRKGSQYSGIAQLGINERTPILKQIGITDKEYKSDINLQRKVADIWVDNLANRLTKSGFDVNDMNMWMAHNLGVGGMNQVLHNKVSKKTLSNIRNQAGMNMRRVWADAEGNWLGGYY